MNLLELFATLTLDTKKYDEALDSSEKQAMSFGDKLKSGLGGATKLLAGGFAAATAAGTAAVAKLTKDAIEAYKNYEQLVGGVETLFGAGGKSIDEYAASVGKSIDQVSTEYDNLMFAQNTVLENSTLAFKTAGLSANEYMETVTSFSASLIQSLDGDTVKAAEVADRAIQDMSDNANKMGTDMSMIQNAYQGFAKQNYTMLDNLKLGYGGTKTEMERLIKDASKMTNIQKELNIEVKDGDTSFANIANAISVVQKKMGIMGTTEKEAATTIEGSFNMMKASWENLVTLLAQDSNTVNDNLNWYVDRFIESAETVGKNVLPRVENAINAIGKLIERAVPIIIEKVPPLIMDVVPKLVTAGANLAIAIGRGLVEGIPQIVAKIPELMNGIFTSIQEFLPQTTESGGDIVRSLIDGIVNGIGMLGDGIQQMFTGITGFINEYLPIVVEEGGKVLQSLATGVVESIPDLLNTAMEVISSFVGFVADNLPTIVQAGIDLLGSFAQGVINGIPNFISRLPEIITNFINFIVNNLGKILQAGLKITLELVGGIISGIPKLVAALPQIGSAIINAITQIPGKVLEIGKNIVEGLWNGISSMAGWIADKVTGFFSGIIDGAKNFLGIHSPSKVFATMGKFSAEGYGEGWDDSFKDIKRSIEKDMDFDTPSVNLGKVSYSGVSPSYSTASSTATSNRTEQLLQTLIDKLDTLNLDQQIVLDTGVLVGQTVNKIDGALGNLAYRNARGVLA